MRQKCREGRWKSSGQPALAGCDAQPARDLLDLATPRIIELDRIAIVGLAPAVRTDQFPGGLLAYGFLLDRQC
jgi:hypothetical protein